MKRRLLLAALGRTFLPVWQALRDGNGTEQPQRILESKVTNKNGKKDLFDVMVVAKSNAVNQLQIPLESGG